MQKIENFIKLSSVADKLSEAIEKITLMPDMKRRSIDIPKI